MPMMQRRLRHGAEGVEGHRRSGRCALPSTGWACSTISGRGVPVDPAQAAKWYGLAAAQKLPDAGEQSGAALCRRPWRAQGYGPAPTSCGWRQENPATSQPSSISGFLIIGARACPKSYPGCRRLVSPGGRGRFRRRPIRHRRDVSLGRGVPKNLSRGPALVHQGGQGRQCRRRRPAGKPAARSQCAGRQSWGPGRSRPGQPAARSAAGLQRRERECGSTADRR